MSHEFALVVQCEISFERPSLSNSVDGLRETTRFLPRFDILEALEGNRRLSWLKCRSD